MCFQMDLFKEGKLVRSILEIERELMINEGKKLQLEKIHPTADGLIFALIDELLGHRMGDIPYDDKSFRCKTTNNYEE